MYFRKYYSSGPAELHFDGKPIGVNALEIVFDSGSSYTYLSSKAYEAVVNQVRSSSIVTKNIILGKLITHLTYCQVKKDLNGKPLKVAADDPSLPVCWKGTKAFKSVHDIKNYFKPFALSFNARKAQLQLPPEAYLIVTVSTKMIFQPGSGK